MQFIIVVLLAVIALNTCSSEDAPVKAEALRIENSRVQEQDKILLSLKSLDHPSVSIFVNDWRKAYPKPTDSNLLELRYIAKMIAEDRNSAFHFTLDYHERNDPSCQVSSPLRDDKCHPGL